ncbi:MAG: signal peptidase I [Ruminococcus sp.]|nr:signal peptidase I [Ruminococcus sp.]
MRKFKKSLFLENTLKIPNFVFDMCKTVIFVFAIVSLVFTFVIRDANIVGSSMDNTLHDGDKIMLTNFMYTPQNNDIIAINAEDMIEKIIIKRVIATEGQTLQIDYNTGEVCVDGIILNEKYISSFTKRPNHDWNIPYVIPKGYVFVMGDNRMISLDSRDSSVGLIPVEDVLGKAQFIFYPFDRISYLY